MPRAARNTSMLGAATPGLSKLAAALAGGDQSYEQGYEGQMGLQSKLAQALAASRAHDAAAQASTARAAQDNAETAVLQGRPAVYEEQVANAAGADVPLVRAIRSTLATGRAPQVPMGPPTEEGAMGVGSQQFDPAVRSKIGAALQQFMPLLINSKDMAPDQLAHAAERFREMGLSDQVIADPTRAGAVFKGQAAAGAKPLFSQNGEGSVLDLGGGSVDQTNPLATASIGLKGAQAGAQRAAAAEHYAGAGHKNAQADEVKNGPKGQIKDTDQGVMVIDPRTGQAIAATGPDGKPLAPKLKEIPAAVNTAIVKNSQNLSKAQQALDLLEGKDVGEMKGDNRATGVRGYLPQPLLNLADPKGVDARAALTDIGSMELHDRSGAAVTVSEMPRLAPFVPLPTDSPEAARKKLKRFVQVYKQEAQALGETYSPSQGYRSSPVLERSAAPTPPAAAPALPSGWSIQKVN